MTPAPRSLRAAGLKVVSPLAGKLLFRLCLGRWPTAAELGVFRAALVDQSTPLPPCLRAMLPFPDAKPLINQLLLLDRVRTGRLVSTNAFDLHHAASQPLTVPPLSGSPLAFWHGPPIAFLHLEKTGGGAFAQALTDACHPDQIDPDPRRTAAPHAVTPFNDRDTAQIRRRALVFGHYDVPSLRRLDPDRPIVTMLRHPAERIVSLYRYWRSIDGDLLDTTAGNDAVKLAQACDLLSFLDTQDPSVRNYIDNFYVRRLTGTYVSNARVDELAEAPDAYLAQAMTTLRGLAFVGITERMTSSLNALRARLDLPHTPSVQRHNAAEDNTRIAPRVFRETEREALKSAHHAALARLTRLDDTIYKHAILLLS